MTKKWWKKTEPLYRRFSRRGRDAGEALAMFRHETYGDQIAPNNRYVEGKRNMDLTVSMWREDVPAGMLCKYELMEDPTFRGIGWWLTRILRTMVGGSSALR